MNDSYREVRSVPTPCSGRLAGLKLCRMAMLALTLGGAAAAQAGTISYNGVQTWDNEFDQNSGTWSVNSNSLAFFDFVISDAAVYDFGITPDSWLSPLGTTFDPYTRMYSPVVQEMNFVFPGPFPGPVFMNPGNYTIVFGYGAFEGDEATESGFNFQGIEGSPAPFADIPFELTITGPGFGVPEPGVMLLMLSGLLGLACFCGSRIRMAEVPWR